jgi:calcineurin B family protein 1
VLRPEEVEELEALSGFKRAEITRLYRRFKILDREATGSLTKNDLLRVPDVAMNPMVHNVLSFFLEDKPSINFKDFVQALGQFNTTRSRDDKLRLVFNAFDSDGDGMLNHSELVDILKSLVGGASEHELSNADLDQLARYAILESKAEEDEDDEPEGIDFDAFKLALAQDADFISRLTAAEVESGIEAYHRKRDRELYANRGGGGGGAN